MTLDIALAIAGALVVATMLRHQLEVIQLVGVRLRAAGELVATSIWKTNEYLGSAIARTITGLQYRGPHYRDKLSTWGGWAVINPVLNTCLFIPLLLADMQLNGLRISGLFGASLQPTFWLGLDQLGGLLMALITVALGLAVWDLCGGVPGAFVWRNLHPALRCLLTLVFALTIVANLAGGVVLSVWAQADHDDLLPVPLIPVPTLVFSAVMMMCLHVAVLAAGVSLPAVVAVLGMALLGLLRLCALLVWVAACLVVVAYEAILAGLVFAVYALAHLGATLHNWLCGFSWSNALGLWPIEPPSRPAQLPPAQLGGWRPQAPRILQLPPPAQ